MKEGCDGLSKPPQSIRIDGIRDRDLQGAVWIIVSQTNGLHRHSGRLTVESRAFCFMRCWADSGSSMKGTTEIFFDGVLTS